MKSDGHQPRILVVEDERTLADLLQENLTAEDYEIEVVNDGESGLATARRGSFDLIILDVMLPGIDGFTICERLRSEGNDVPVLFLTAKVSATDRVHGFEVGGDDYLPKPFHLRELLLRVGAILRRNQWYGQATAAGAALEFGENRVDFRSYRGTSWDGREQALTYKEAMILKVLSEREGEVVSRDEILQKVWG
ncbi:MAG: response regulator transcription factor, partial [Candidatus Eisenbacteria bacterium]|nr:response regulator transcription factor [Candidatus Eisenbacteria bacterium]